MRFPREQEQELVGNGFTGANGVPALPSVAEADDESGAHVPLLVGGESYEFAALANLDLFFMRVYRYWNEHGLRSILLSGALNLLALAFTAAFSTFLLLFVDWRALHAECLAPKAAGGGGSGADPAAAAAGADGGGGGRGCDLAAVALDRRPLLGRGVGADLLAVSYIAVCVSYLGWTAAHYLMDARDMREVAHFLATKLGINDSKVVAMTWPEVVHRLVLVQRTTRLCIARDLDELDIVARIMRKDNYLIAMINRDVLQLHLQPPTDAPPRLRTAVGGALLLLGAGSGGGCGGGRGCPPMLTKTLEWNLRWCILDHMFDDEFRIRPGFSDVAALKRRLRMVAAANLLLSPFLLLFLLAYFFMRNAERIYHHPAALGSRRWSGLARWRIRELNELPHYLYHRLNAGHPAALRYVAQFPSYNLASVARFMVFLTGSFVALLLFMTFLDESLLERPLLGRQVVWWLGTMTLVLATCRTLVSEEPVAYDPERALADVVSYTHYLPRHWRGRAHTAEVQSAFLSLFRLKVALFVEEIFSLVTTPLVMACSLPACAEAIVEFVSTFTVHVDGVGDVCSLATFDLARHGNAKYGSPVHAEKAFRSRQGKLEKSILTFKETYSTWEPGELGRRLLAAPQAKVAGGGGAAAASTTAGDVAAADGTAAAGFGEAPAGPMTAAGAAADGVVGVAAASAASRRLFERLSYQQGGPSMFPYHAAAGMDKIADAAAPLTCTASTTQLRARPKLTATGEHKAVLAGGPVDADAAAQASAAGAHAPSSVPAVPSLHPGGVGGCRHPSVPLHMLPYHGVKSYLSNASQLSAGGGGGGGLPFRPPPQSRGGPTPTTAASGPVGGSPAPSVASSQFSNLAAPHLQYYPVPLYYAHQQQARHAAQQQRRMYEQMLYGAMAYGINPMVAPHPPPPPPHGRRLAASSAAASWYQQHAVPRPYDMYGLPYPGFFHPQMYTSQAPPSSGPPSPGSAAPQQPFIAVQPAQPPLPPPQEAAVMPTVNYQQLPSSTGPGQDSSACKITADGCKAAAGSMQPRCNPSPCPQVTRTQSEPIEASTAAAATRAGQPLQAVHAESAAPAPVKTRELVHEAGPSHRQMASCQRADFAAAEEGDGGRDIVASRGRAMRDLEETLAAGCGGGGDSGAGMSDSPDRSVGAGSGSASASGVGTGSATVATGCGSDILDMRGVEDMAAPLAPPAAALPYDDDVGGASAGGSCDAVGDDPLGLYGFVRLPQRRHVPAVPRGGGAADEDDLDGFGLVPPAALGSSPLGPFGSGSGSGTGSGSGVVLRRWCPAGSGSASSLSAAPPRPGVAKAAATVASTTAAAAEQPPTVFLSGPLPDERAGVHPLLPTSQPHDPEVLRRPSTGTATATWTATATATQAPMHRTPQPHSHAALAPPQLPNSEFEQPPPWLGPHHPPGSTDPSPSQLYYSADYYAASSYYGLDEYGMYDCDNPMMFDMGVAGSRRMGTAPAGMLLPLSPPLPPPPPGFVAAATGVPFGVEGHEVESWADASASEEQQVQQQQQQVLRQRLSSGQPEPCLRQRQQRKGGEEQSEEQPRVQRQWLVEPGEAAGGGGSSASGGGSGGGGGGQSRESERAAAATAGGDVIWPEPVVTVAAAATPGATHAAAASTGATHAAAASTGGIGGSSSSFATHTGPQLHSRLAQGHAMLQSLYESNDHTVQQRLQQHMHVRSFYLGASGPGTGNSASFQRGGSDSSGGGGGGSGANQSSRGFGWPPPGVQD